MAKIFLGFPYRRIAPNEAFEITPQAPNHQSAHNHTSAVPPTSPKMNFPGAGAPAGRPQMPGGVDPNDPNARVKFLAAEPPPGVSGLPLDTEGQRFVDELQHRDSATDKMWENGKVSFVATSICRVSLYCVSSSSPFALLSTAKPRRRSSGTASTTLVVVS